MARKNILNRSIFSGRTSGKHELGEQLIIRVGKGCNFRCIFCNVAENESVLSIKSSIKEILAITFYKIKYSNFTSNEVNVTISGGEPSIFQKETLFILKYFSKYFSNRGIYVNFDLQSNASNIDENFAKKLASNGVRQALISSHTHDPIIFQKIIGVDYKTMGPRFEAGVQNLLNAGILVTFNIVLNKLTIPSYIDHLKYLIEKYPSVTLYNIGYVQPHGMAQSNFIELVAPYKDMYVIYNRAISYLKSRGKIVHSHYVGPPLCYMDDWVTSMEYMNNVSLLKRVGSDRTLIQSINDTNKTHPNACNRCIAKRVCSGVWKEYEKQELKTIPYEVRTQLGQFDEANLTAIKKLYSSGKRQFFFDLNTVSGEFIQEIRSLGFMWVTLQSSAKTNNISFESYASTNFQIYGTLEDVSNWVREVGNYNKNISFQFQIQLDFIISDLSLDNILLEKLTPSLGSNIHIHIAHKSTLKKITSSFIHYYTSSCGK